MKIKPIDLDSDSFSKEFVKSLKETGFAVIRNSNVLSKIILDRMYEDWRNYFKQPLEEKLKNKFDPSSDNQAGYFPYKSENAKDQKLSDLKEFYHYYNKQDLPGEGSPFTPFIMKDLKSFSVDLLNIIDGDLNKGFELEESVENGSTLLRILYYPEIPSGEQGVRAAAHEDINLITLLPAATATGLEVQDLDGNWHGVGTEPGDIIVNVGDALQMYSKGKYKSTTHRVVNMPGDRLSMPLFVHPRLDFNLGEMTAGEYLSKRLKEIGLK